MSGTLYGLGVGPGDPELITLKAWRIISQTPVIAYPAANGQDSLARRIASPFIPEDVIELAIPVPMRVEREPAQEAYDEAARTIATHLEQGRDVAFLCEGDPLFYGSYMHLHVRLAPRWPAEVIPGITAMSGCWSQAGLPLVQGDDVLAVLPGTLPETELARRLADSAASVIMKVGRNLPVIRRALATAGKLGRAVYVERGTMERTVTTPLAAKADDLAPYFSLVLVPGWERRP